MSDPLTEMPVTEHQPMTLVHLCVPYPEPVHTVALTPKEQEVLGYLAMHYDTVEIAEAMFVSINTIRTHIRHILNKLAVPRRGQAVRRARELGLVNGRQRGDCGTRK